MKARRTVVTLTVGSVLMSLTVVVARGPSEAEDQGRDTASKPSGQPVNVFVGTVLDAEGNAVVGVTVAVADADVGGISWGDTVSAHAPEERVLLFFSKHNGKRAGTTNTDEKGQFALRGLQHGRYNLAVIEPLVGVTLLPDLPFSPSAEPIRITRDLAFRVASTLTIKGRVLDSDGNPASGAIVAVADATHGHIYHTKDIGVSIWGPEHLDGFAWFTLLSSRAGKDGTNEVGEFTITGLRPGKYNLVAMHAEKGASLLQDVDVSDDTRSFDLKLDPPTFAAGTVTGLSMPLGIFRTGYSLYSLVPEGLPANVEFRQTVDLSDGISFRVGPLPPAKRWRLVAMNPVPKQGYFATVLDAPVNAGKVEVDLNRGMQFSGQVRGPEGGPLGGVSVLARPHDDAGLAVGAVSDADGKFTVKGLAPGQYELAGLRHTIRTGPG